MREEVFQAVQDLPAPRAPRRSLRALWHHTHLFEDLPPSATLPEGGTRMTDLVRYRVGWGFIGHIVTVLWVRKDIAKIFKYRQQVLTERFRPAPNPRTAP